MTQEPRRRRPYVARMPVELRREQLMDAAQAIIERAGVTQVSVDAVAREAGVSRTVVYNVFDDSDHILRDLLRREEQFAMGQLLSRIPADLLELDPVEVATTLVGGILDSVLDEPQRWRTILLPVDGQPGPVQRAIARAYGRLLDLVSAYVTAAVERGTIETDDVELLSRLMLDYVTEVGRLALRDPDGYPRERLVGFAAELMGRVVVTEAHGPA